MNASKGPRVKVTVRLPSSFAREIRTMAEKDGKSVNEYVIDKLFEALAK